MREYQYIHVKGIPFFKDQKFDLSQKGISAILGLNTNSGKTGNTNFVGKSLFFSQIMETVAPSREFTNPKDRLRTGFTEVGVKVGSTEYKIRRVYKSPEKLLIAKNGVKLDIHTLSDARDYAERIIGGYSTDVLSLLMYLDNTKTHLIRTGDTAVRRKFFTGFFDLAAADEIKKLVKKDKDELRAKALVFEELKSRMSVLKEQKAGLDAKAIRLALLDANAKAQGTMARLEDLRRIDQVSSFIEANELSVKLFRKYDSTADKLRKELRQVKAWLTMASAINEYKAECALYGKRLEAYQNYLSENELTDFDAEEAKKGVQSLLGTIKQAEKAHYDELRSYDQRVSKKADFEAKLEKVRNSLNSLKREGDCSKCGQPVTNKHYNKERADLKAEVAELEEAIAGIDVGEKPVMPEPSKKLARLQAKIDLLSNGPKEPEKVTRPEGLKALPPGIDVESLHERQSKIRTILRAIETVAQSGFSDVIKEDNFQPLREGEYEEALRDATKATEVVSKLESDLMRAEALNKEGSELSARIKALSVELDELEVLDVMEKAFSGDRAGSIKQIIIQGLCSKLEEQVNKYSKLLLPEDYDFTFDLQTQFSITVSRNVGGKAIASDVRKLSGAEASCFNLVLTMSLLTFVPPAKRPNILILDEFNANFSAEMTSSFVRFLPTLNQVIPHIVIITPRTEDNYGDQVKYYTVIKQGSESKIVPGKHRTAPVSRKKAA